MATGFIYVVTTLKRDYMQKAKCNVPTEWGNRLYFGPCKIPMRKKMQPGDFIFGISPAELNPRRIVFVAQIEERITFAEAYHRFSDLHGPEGPIHVRPRPIKGTGKFPFDSYEHIEGAMHPHRWTDDIKTRELDAFFICHKCDDWCGKWLGINGPEIDETILKFLKMCSVHGPADILNHRNPDATQNNPVCHGRLYRGLHLETDKLDDLLKLCNSRIAPDIILHGKSRPSGSPATRRSCGKSSRRKGCS